MYSAVCSVFAGIHSTLTPQCIDALFGVRIPFQSLVQRVIHIPVRQSRVQSMFTRVSETFLYLSCDTRNAWSFYYIWHSFGLQVFLNERLLNLLSLLLQDFLVLSCLHVRSRRNLLLLFTAGHRYTHRVFHRHSLRELLLISYIYSAGCQVLKCSCCLFFFLSYLWVDFRSLTSSCRLTYCLMADSIVVVGLAHVHLCSLD